MSSISMKELSDVLPVDASQYDVGGINNVKGLAYG